MVRLISVSNPIPFAGQSLLQMASDESYAWVSSGGEYVKARVISQGEDGNAVLEVLETKEIQTQPSDVRALSQNP